MNFCEKLKSRKGNIILSPIFLEYSDIYYEWKNKNNAQNEIVFDTYKDGKFQNIEEAENDIKNMMSENAFAIINNNKLIGFIGFKNLYQSNQRADIWLKINPEIDIDKQIELGMEALDTLINYAYDMLNLNSLIVTTPAFNRQMLAILKNSNMRYLGSRSKSELYKENNFYDKIYYQTTRKSYYDYQKSHNEQIDETSKIIPITGDIRLNKCLVGDRIVLEKQLVPNKEYTLQLIKYLSNSSLSIPLGEFKDNWHHASANEQLSYYDYLIKEDDKLIGIINLFRKDKRNHTADLEILIGEQYQGKGYAKEAMLLLLKEAFNNGNYVNILSSIFDFNIKSKALHKKIGFEEFGIRNEAYYAYGKLHNMHFNEISLNQYRKKRK